MIGFKQGGQWSLTAKAFSPPYGNHLKQVVCQFICDKREFSVTILVSKNLPLLHPAW